MDRRHFLRIAALGGTLALTGGHPAALAARSSRTASAGAAAGPSDATATLERILQTTTGELVFPPGTYPVFGELVVPHAITRIVLAEGAVIRQHADATLLRRQGSIGAPVAVPGAFEGASEIHVLGHACRVGDWVYVCSDDWLVQGKSKFGMLRRVTALTAAGLQVDRPLVRTMTMNVRLHRILLAPPLEIAGNGAIEHADPTSTRYGLVRYDFAANPVIRGVTLRQSGGPAALLWATVGGDIDCFIHDCLDDQRNAHYGYGVEVRSATRDLHVRGRIERCRHAFTTNGGWTPPEKSLLHTGEPENILVSPVVRNTSATGLDTHEPGKDIWLVPDVDVAGQRKWGGVNVRARDVRVLNGSIRNAISFGVLVQPSASGTTIENTTIEGVSAGAGIQALSTTTVSRTTVRGAARSGLLVGQGTAVHARELVVEGTGASTGVAVRSSGSDLQGVVRRCDVGLLEATGTGIANLVDLRFEQCRRDRVSRPAW